MRSNSGHILWVGPPSSPTFSALASKAAAHDCTVEHEPDVYSATVRLACLGDESKRSNPLLAVALHVDALDARDFEFIQIVSEHFRDVTIWAVTECGLESKVQLAHRVGAGEELTLANVEAMLVSVLERAQETWRLQPRVAPRSERPPIQDASIAASERAAEPSDSNPGESKSKPSEGGAPVPWVRHPRAPRRTPPGRSSSESSTQPKQEIEADLPLLTDEELEALIGREARRRDGHSASEPARGSEPVRGSEVADP